MLSNDELEKAMRWVIRGLQASHVERDANVHQVVIWMLENQLPAKEVWLAEVATQDEVERLALLASLEAKVVELKAAAPDKGVEDV